MRVGLIAPPWLPVPPAAYGGTEVVVDVLARGLRRAGVELRLFTTADSTCPVPSSFAYLAPQRDRMNQTVPELYHAMAAYENLAGFDVIHDHTVAGPVIARLMGEVPVVTTNHGPFTEELRRIYHSIDDRVEIVAVSHHQAAQAEGVRISRVIHHGLDLDTYQPGSGAGGHLLFLGRMAPDKGVHIAARVARAAGRRLLIAARMSEPLERRYFREQVEPLLGNDIIYLGEADQQTKNRLLAGASALVNPIQWDEPFGLVMIEALASATPVIAFPEGAAPEIVDDGVTGFLPGGEEEMVEAVNRLGTIERSSCRLSFEERFSAERMVGAYLDLYQSVARHRLNATGASA